jgi:hypothetical protein
VHAASGVLPVKSIQIPAEQFATSLASIEMTFLTAPVLTSVGSIDLPLPEAPGYTWTWLEKTHGILKDGPQAAPTPGPVNLQAGSSARQELREGWLRLKKSADARTGDGEQEKTK